MDRVKNEGRGEWGDANCNERIRCKLKGGRNTSYRECKKCKQWRWGCKLWDKDCCKLQIVRRRRDNATVRSRDASYGGETERQVLR
jgi:hypothetical protein